MPLNVELSSYSPSFSLRATSISNVTLGGESSSGSNRRSSDCVDAGASMGSAEGGGGGRSAGASDLARKRATSAQGLDRNPTGETVVSCRD